MNNNYNRMLRQLQVLSKRLADLLAEKREADKNEAQLLVLKIKQLVYHLSKTVSRRQMRKALGGLALMFGLAAANPAQAQNFAAPQNNPFGLTPMTDLSIPVMVDLDGDGDLDMIISDYGTIKYFQNTGTANNPQFATPINNPFGISTPADYCFLAFGDLDNDGDLDLIMGEYYGVVKYFQNTGTATAPQFASPISNPFGITSGSLLAVPTLADVDGDGDLDLLIGDYAYYGYGQTLRYFRNTGTASVPAFTLAVTNNPFQNVDPGYLAIPHLVDLDNDGDLDLLVGASYGDILYFKNNGTATTPNFATVPQVNPFGLQSAYFVAFIAAGDLDNDGDIDLMIGEYGGITKYYRNTTINLSLGDEYTFDFRVYPNPATDVVRIQTGVDVVAHAELLDINGRVVKSTDYLQDGINISDLAAGVYMLRLTNQRGEIGVKRLVKN